MVMVYVSCIGGLARLNNPYGVGSGPIVLDDVRCNGNEEQLLDCRSNGPLNHDCSHNDDISIMCVEGTNLSCIVSRL